MIAEERGNVDSRSAHAEQTAPEYYDDARYQVAGVSDFWRRIDSARHRYLFLDYDGTLAPFHVDRMQAVPLPGTTDALDAILRQGDTTVALVSGRPVAEVLALLGDVSITVVGSHGYEVRRGDGIEHVIDILPEQATVLDTVFAEALEIFDPARLERKAASVAAHFRGLDPTVIGAIEQELERRWRAAASGELLEFRPFNGGLELRAAGRNKGTAIQELLVAAPQGSVVVYIGDDDTDEDAFGALPEHGIGIKVGPSDAVTKAVGRVPDCAAVRQILIDWSANVRGQARE
jgi:trehalose 6-phosphate phosphatase